MEIKQIQYFLAVATTGSFSAAADELYITQSSISKQILALEKELGFSLFDRSKRKIILTQAGETFLKHARSLNADYQTMLADLGKYKTAPNFSIIAIPVIAQYGITTHLAQFKNAHPKLNFTLDEREAGTILPALNNHQYDLAFIRDYTLDGEIYSFLKIARDKLQVLVSKNHHFAGRKSIALAELADENFIMFDKGTIVHELTVDACRQAGFEPRIFYASLRVESILGLVVSNSGIALMMEKIYTYHQPRDVVAIPLQENIESNLVLAWLKNKQLPQPARVFIEFMQKRLSA
jgi:LysR family transcriptional regulator, transcription activator of glutamate synthase operon